ncbi:XRE family transcriptional regulator [Paraburkholderia sp. RL17-383-BIF-A]|uniref:XRE family transcriptional regulator n=1 Tax=Paraburkholderia sp. RL17-383-BIF-A TaxID=3031631 RepID=UPI0038BDC8A3
MDTSSRERTKSPVRFLPKDAISACPSFRDAVRLAWENRVQRGMTQSMLAGELHIPNSHMSGILSRTPVDKHGKARRDLPARSIAEFERLVGNHAVTQYLMRMGMLTLMEEVLSRENL